MITLVKRKRKSAGIDSRLPTCFIYLLFFKIFYFYLQKGTDFYDPNQADRVPPRWRHIKRVSVASARRDSSKMMPCEHIESRTPAQYDLYNNMKSVSTNENDEYTPTKKVVRVEHPSSSLYACFPSSIMMFIADEDKDYFDSASYDYDAKL